MLVSRQSGLSFRSVGFIFVVCGLLAAGASSLSTHARAADEFSLELPVDCSPGATCFVQNYVDIDPGPGAQDFTCGALTYNDHKGVDFRVPDLLEAAKGVSVLAAASGTVLRVRDAVQDGFPDEIGEAQIEGAECGNGIVIDHGGGWETQSCHLRNGSVTVKPGQRVEVGEPIASVGMSGKAEFPHLHLAVRYQGRVVDPYVGQEPSVSCGGDAHPLWSAAAQGVLAYRPSGVVNAGFTSVSPTLRNIETGEVRQHSPGSNTNLIMYVRFFGLQPGDQQRFHIFDPNDAIVAETTTAPAEKSKAQWMQFIGRRAPAQSWPSGIYRGQFELLRDGVVVLTATPQIEIP